MRKFEKTGAKWLKDKSEENEIGVQINREVEKSEFELARSDCTN